jgi:hypothetical protein
MSFDKISFIILILSFLGLAILIIRKLPVLAALPLAGDDQQEGGAFKFFGGIKKMPGLKAFSKEVVLHKIISKIRILSIKTDHKTFNWLKNLREKSQKEKLENENYWEEIKNSKDLKK